MTDRLAKSERCGCPTLPHERVARRFKGRFLDGQLKLIYGNVYAEGGYAVDVRSGEIYRNGELVGWVRRLYFDRDVLGWWVEYLSWRGSALDVPSVADHQERHS